MRRILALPHGAADTGGDFIDAAALEERVECAVTPCVVALAARGGAHVCALFADKTVACWGADDKGQLGRGDGNPLSPAHPAPVLVPNAHARVIGPSRSRPGTAGSTPSSKASEYAGSRPRAPAPLRSVLVEAVSVSVGPNSACAIVGRDRTVPCWGRNDFGSLGDGATVHRRAPVAVVAER